MTVQEFADQLERLIEQGRRGGLSDEVMIVKLEAAVEVLEEELSKPEMLAAPAATVTFSGSDRLLSDMQSAPRDGSAIEIQHGPQQTIVLAHWSEQAQAWIKFGDPLRKALSWATGWRPALTK